MKRIIIYISITVFAVSILAKPVLAKPEITVGLAGMYDWWKPAFMNLHSGKVGRDGSWRFDEDYDGSFMLGPTLYAKLNGQWAIGTTLLIGLNKNEFSYTSWQDEFLLWTFITGASPFGSGPLGIGLEIGRSKARRYDWDVKLERGLNKYLNLLIGMRFNYADGEGDTYRFPFSPNLNIIHRDYSDWQIGPSLGLGFKYTIKGFTIKAGASALITFGNYNLEKSYLRPLITLIIPDEYDVNFMGLGLDTNIGFAYYIAPAHIELSLGFRYIVTPRLSLSDDGSPFDPFVYNEGWMTGTFDHFYGITFGVAYRI